MNVISRRSFVKHAALAGGYLALKAENGYATNLVSPQGSNKKVFIFSKHLQWLSYKETAETAKNIGFDGIDLTVRPKGHVLPENAEKDLPEAVNTIRKTGIIVDTITTAITSIDSPNAESILRTAGELAVKQYRMGWIKYNEKISFDKNLINIREQLLRLAELNEKYGVRGDYQNHSGTSFGSSVWDLWQVLTEMNTQWVGCRYDIRHATAEAGGSWPVGLRAIEPFIKSLDIKDFIWENRENQAVLVNKPIGEGWVDFERYYNFVKELNIQGNFTMHFEYPLGGADKGHYKINISPEIVIDAMKKDLTAFKKYLQ